MDLIGIRLGYNFHPPANFIGERKRLEYKNNNYLKKTYHNWTKANNYKHLASSKTKSKKVCEGFASRVHFALCGCHGKHNKSMVLCVSQIMIKNKKKNFPLNQNMTCANW